MKKLFVIFLVSFITQLIFIAVFKIPTERDAYEYNEMAINVTRGKGISNDGVNPTLGSSKPAYILFLALIYKIFNQSILMVKIIQALLIAGTCILTYKIGTDLIDERIGYYSALIMAIHPALLIISSHLIAESLFTFLLALTIFYLIKAVREKSFKLYLFSGILLGVTTQVHFTTFFFPLFILAGLLLIYKEKLYALKVSIVIFLIVMVMGIPWAIRNYIHFGYLNPFLEYSGSLWLGSYTKGDANSDNPEVRKIISHLFKEMEERYYQKDINDTRKFAVEYNKTLLSLAIKNIKEDPLGYIGLSPKKILRLWIGSYSGLFRIGIPFSDFLYNIQLIKQHPFILLWKLFVFLFSLVIFCLAIIGVVLGFKMWRKFLPLYLIVGYFALLHMVLFAETRVGIPSLPYMIIFATLGVFLLLNKNKKGRA